MNHPIEPQGALQETSVSVESSITSSVETAQKHHSSMRSIITGLIVLLLITAGVGLYYVKKYSVKPIIVTKKIVAGKPINTPVPNSHTVLTPIIDTNVNRWKTYTTSYYSIQYPETWFVTEYPTTLPVKSHIYISDVQNPYTTPHTLGSLDHQIISILFILGSMPTDYPYTNGATYKNPTIKPFSLNGYVGIRGEATLEGTTGSWSNKPEATGIADVVDLTKTQNGYIHITNEQGSTELFNLILNTIKLQ